MLIAHYYPLLNETPDFSLLQDKFDLNFHLSLGFEYKSK